MNTLKPVFPQSIDDELSANIAGAFAGQIARCVLLDISQKATENESIIPEKRENSKPEKSYDIAR